MQEILCKKFIVFIEKPQSQTNSLRAFEIYWQNVSQPFDIDNEHLEAKASLPLTHIKAWIEAYRQTGFEIQVAIPY